MGTRGNTTGGNVRHVGRRVGGVLALALWSVTAGAVQAAPEQVGVVPGVCKLRLTLDSGPNVGLVPGQPTWSVNGSGPCVVPSPTLQTGTLSGTLMGLAPTSAGCAAGVYRGNLTFNVAGVIEQVDAAVVAAVMAGAVLEITMATPTTFAGAGAFAETSTMATVDCPLTGNTQTTWKGLFAFVGPEPDETTVVRAGNGWPR